MSKVDIRKQYLKLAYEQLNPTTNDMGALQQVLVNWFCFQFNTTPNDQRLLDMRLDELLVLRMMHEIKERPQVVDEIKSGYEEFEEWLKTQMGDSYKSIDQMASDVEKLDQQEQEIAEELPTRIDTDFNSVQGG